MTSKKHYVAVAKMFAEAVGETAVYPVGHRALLGDIAHGLANIYQDENPRFDRERFMRACGLEG
jgi:hypothetical protein